MRTTATMIAEEAAQWVARLDREGESEGLRADMQAWADGDERRKGALLRAEACWRLIDRAAELDDACDGEGVAEGAGERGDEVAFPEQAEHDTQGLMVGDAAMQTIGDAHSLGDEETKWGGATARQRWWRGGAAAAVAAALALVVTPYVSAPPVQQIETVMGEIRRVPLADGSLAAVNTDSKVEVALKPEQRHVRLERGEVWFQVAKDAERPFVVEAGDVRVQAVGTAFSVHKLGDHVDVRVTEGVVDVWRVGQKASRKRVVAGAQAVLAQHGAAVAAVSSSGEPVERALSWRDGQLIFDGDSVAYAAEQFNRYNQVKIEISDTALGEEKMIGRFRTNEPQAFARAVAAIVHAKVDVRGDRIILSAH
ncbi:FecR family protein [Sphingopyxis yananensis]|uniref:FecR family protein n=1 Tax=Sphingopyxis yananensis TaxID=2886687 RepID=UPI001D0FD8CD|nr:FecR domain-containing protein [Sphingopyxis yananensis]MCC2601633.1 FecR domain-containing protein [Sphingopyxis yananensis]